jgi:hypothetical protein
MTQSVDLLYSSHVACLFLEGESDFTAVNGALLMNSLVIVPIKH